jgi:glycosyl transferase, family 25
VTDRPALLPPDLPRPGPDAAAAALPVFCINLDSRPDRMAHMEAQSRAAGISLIRMPAVDAGAPEIQRAAQTIAIGLSGRRMGAGNIACNESHRACLRALLASDAPYAIVLEDDVYLAPDFARLTAADWVPADADVVKLETWGVRVHLDPAPIKVGSRELRRLHSSHYGAAGYVIARATAERLLAATEGATDPFDDIVFCLDQPAAKTLNVYQMVPAPVIQAQRQEQGQAAFWAASSISERFAGGHSESAGPEPLLPRLRRRLANEWLARRQGTRYVKVPHG